jgi:general L-amino acid transport system substrate-binding protein
MMKRSVLVVALLALQSSLTAAGTLDDVKSRGVLVCGVNGELPGFSTPNGGNWVGFDVDYCRAYAAATLNNASKVKYVSLTAQDRFSALHAGDIDVLVGNATWSPAAEAQFGILGTAVNYYDGQGFMLRKALKLTSALRLIDRTICVQRETISEANLADFFGAERPKQKTLAFVDRDEALRAYAAGKCDAFTADASTLYGARLKMPNGENHDILADLISREPLTPYVRKGDDEWFDVVRWVHFAMVDAEILNVTQINVDQQGDASRPAIKRFLGSEANSGEQMGLTRDWAYRVIKQVGNYDEVFEQNLGRGSPLHIGRGLNQLWTAGGLLYAPSFH